MRKIFIILCCGLLLLTCGCDKKDEVTPTVNTIKNASEIKKTEEQKPLAESLSTETSSAASTTTTTEKEKEVESESTSSAESKASTTPPKTDTTVTETPKPTQNTSSAVESTETPPTEEIYNTQSYVDTADIEKLVVQYINEHTERKSPQSFIAEAQKNLGTAEKIQPCVAVTEPNWQAMISTQRMQIELLKEIQETLPTLTTAEQLQEYLNQQLKVLTECTAKTQTATELYQVKMENLAKDLKLNIEETVKTSEKQAGSMKESFSQNLSMLKENTEDMMSRYMSRMFWVSLIPTAVLILLELIRPILSATSVI